MPRSVKKMAIRDVIDRMVKRIVRKFRPEQVILFGSQARGDAGPDSDVDLLVVMDFEGAAHEMGLEILQALDDRVLSVDVIVTRPDDFAWRKQVVGTIEWPAAREGKILYMREASPCDPRLSRNARYNPSLFIGKGGSVKAAFRGAKGDDRAETLPRPVSNPAIVVLREWLAKADNDLKAAAHALILGDDCPTETVCFHAQQCIEKYMKALLVFRATPVPKTHNIRHLRLLLPPKFRPQLDGKTQDLLTRYAVLHRYPGAGPDISLAEARKAVAIARRVRKEVRSHLPPAARRRAKK